MMRTLSQEEFASQLHQINENLRGWLGSMVPAVASTAATTLQINAILSELLRAGEWLEPGLPSEPTPHLNSEITAYRNNLEELRDLMPYIHAQLVRERAKLEEERARLESAAEWACRSKQSL